MVETFHSQRIQSLSGQRVLDDGVFDGFLAHFGTQSGVFLDGDPLIVHQDTGTCVLDAFGQSGHDRLLFAENLCVWHV